MNILQVTEKVFKELQSQKLHNRHVNAIVSRLALEVEKLTSAHLVQFCEYCIHCIQHSDGEQTRWVGVSDWLWLTFFCSSITVFCVVTVLISCPLVSHHYFSLFLLSSEFKIIMNKAPSSLTCLIKAHCLTLLFLGVQNFVLWFLSWHLS